MMHYILYFLLITNKYSSLLIGRLLCALFAEVKITDSNFSAGDQPTDDLTAVVTRRKGIQVDPTAKHLRSVGNKGLEIKGIKFAVCGASCAALQ